MISYSHLIKKVSGFGILNTTQLGLRFVVTILFAQLLSPDPFGTVALASVILTIISLGLQWGAVEAVMQDTNHDHVFSTIVWLKAGASLLFLVVLAFLSFPLRWVYPDEVINITLLLAVPFFLLSMSAPFKGAIQQNLSLVRIGAVQLFAVVIGAGLGLIIAARRGGTDGLVLYYGTINMLTAIGYVLLSPQYPHLVIDRETAGWVLNFARDMLVSELFISVQQRGDDLIVGTLGSTGVLGVYRVAWQLSSAFRLVIQPMISEGITPVFAQLDNKERSKRAIEFVFRMQLYLSVPAFVIVGLVAPELVRLVFGSEWIGMAPILRILAVAGILYSLVGTAGKFYHARGEADMFSRLQRTFVSTMILGLIVLVPLFDGIGAALAMSGSQLLAVVLIFRQLRRQLHLSVAGVVVSPFISGFVSVTVGIALQLGIFWNAMDPMITVALSALVVTICFYCTLLIVARERVVRDISFITSSLFGSTSGFES